MKYKTIVGLIEAHYNMNSQQFFLHTIDVLKELKASGKQELADYLSDLIMPYITVRPKIQSKPKDSVISFEDAACLGWVPQEESNNE